MRYCLFLAVLGLCCCTGSRGVASRLLAAGAPGAEHRVSGFTNCRPRLCSARADRPGARARGILSHQGPSLWLLHRQAGSPPPSPRGGPQGGPARLLLKPRPAQIQGLGKQSRHVPLQGVERRARAVRAAAAAGTFAGGSSLPGARRALWSHLTVVLGCTSAPPSSRREQ